MKQKPKIGLALGAGASRGFAHIGVLEVLEENGIKPDYIAGSSIGSVIGAIYATGMPTKIMEGIAENLNSNLYDIGFSRRGFIRGNRVVELIKLLTKDQEFKDLNIPLAVTAVDLISCERVIIQEGKVYQGVRASISIPGVFQPVEVGDKVLVDGGILERVPVNVARNMGADIVIGVDVAFHGRHRPPENFIETIIQTMEVMELEIVKNTISTEDIIIRPQVILANPLSLDNVSIAVEAGRKAARAVMDELRELLENDEDENGNLQQNKGLQLK
jgi:NTE family protein